LTFGRYYHRKDDYLLMALIPIYASMRHGSSFLGWTLAKCAFCDTFQAFCCYKLSSDAKIYGVTVSSYQPHSVRTVCSFCGRTFDWPVKTDIPVTPDWLPENGLQALAEMVRPDAGLVPNRQHYTDGEVYAILKQAYDDARAKAHGLPTIILAVLLPAFLFAVLSMVAGMMLAPASDAFLFAFVGGGIAGLVISYTLLLRFYRVRLLVGDLRHVCGNFGLATETLTSSMAAYPDADRGIRAAVAQFTARPN
jgi:hypothetical protein